MDAVGNESNVIDSFVLEIDRTPPTVSVERSDLFSLDVLFSESIATSAADPSMYDLVAVGGPNNGQSIGVGLVELSGSMSATIEIPSLLPAGDYRLTIQREISDLAGNRLVGENTFNFTVEEIRGNLWINVGGGIWKDPNNWSKGRVPNNSDDVFIVLDGTYEIIAREHIAIGSLTLGGASGTQTLSLPTELGAARGNADCRPSVFGQALCTAHMEVSGPTVVNDTGVLVLDGFNELTINGDLLVDGHLIKSGPLMGTGSIMITSVGKASIAGRGGTTIQNDIENLGVITIVNSTMTIVSRLENRGVVEFDAGTLAFIDPYTLPPSGTFRVSSGKSGTLQSPQFVNDGTVAVESDGTFTFSDGVLNRGTGLFSVEGTFSAVDSTLNGKVPLMGGSIQVIRSTYNVFGTLENGAEDRLFLADATINGDVVNQGLIEPHRSTFINGSLTTTAGSTISLSGTSVGDGRGPATLTLSDGFTNHGLIELTNDALNPREPFWSQLVVSDGTLINAASGEIRVLVGEVATTHAVLAELDNQGTVTAVAPLLIQKESADHVNSGTINATEANLTIVQSGETPTFSNSGTITIGAERSVHIDRGDVILQTGSVLASRVASLTEFGVFESADNMTLDGILRAEFVGGFVPNVDDTFRVVRYGSRTGEFATILSPTSLPDGKVLNPIHNDNDVTLVTAQSISLQRSPRTVVTDPASITAEDAQVFLNAAVGRWEVAGASREAIRQLYEVEIVIADLSSIGDVLALESQGTIWIDDDAAGIGWFLDESPLDDTEFQSLGGTVLKARSGQAAHDRVDLMTVLLHELGHVLGIDHDNDIENDLMDDRLSVGQRRLLMPAHVDLVFASNG